MGGDYVPSNDGDSCMEDDFSLLSSDSATFLRDDVSMMVEDGTVNGGRRVNFQESVEKGGRPFGLDFEVHERRRHSVNREILQSYDELKIRCENLKEAKEKILSYSPGAWTEKVGGLKLSGHEVPKTTCLILVGPKASGKSSLINRISKVFEDDKFTPARAQVSYNSPTGDGTYFLQEFMIPRNSTSFCLYDTRSLSDDSHENDIMLSRWMTKGVHHGELVVRNTDDQSLRKSLKCKARNNDSISTVRQANFVIYVVNGLSILKAMESTGTSETQYIETIASTFNSPYLSFKDDKPVLVVTHGDLLSVSDRARVRAHLGEVLGIPPAKQIFDISECDDPVTDFTITEMLRYALEHADKNYPLRRRFIDKVYKVTQPSLYMILFDLLLLGVAILLAKDMFIGTSHIPHACSGNSYASHSHHVNPKFTSYQAKQEVPPHYTEPEFPTRQVTEAPSNHAVKPNSPSYHAKQEVPSHYAEPEVPSQDSAKVEVSSHHAVKPKFPSYQAEPEVPSLQEMEVPSHYAEPEVPSHDSSKLEVPSNHAVKPNFPFYQAKEEVPPHYAEPEVPSHYAKLEVPSHDSAKLEVPSNHSVKPILPSYQAKQEVPPHYVEPKVPSCQESEVPSHHSAKPKVPKHQAKPKIASHHSKREVPPHHAEPDVPSRQVTKIPSHDATKTKFASHRAEQVVPHYAEPEVPSPQVTEIPSHDAAKPEVPKHQEVQKIASHQAKQEVPSRQAVEDLCHDAAKPKVRKSKAKPKVRKSKAKPKIASPHAKQKVPSHREKLEVHVTEPKIVWHKIKHMWL